MPPEAADHAAEVRRGERFEFGANWKRFLGLLSEQRIAEAEDSLCKMLGVQDLRGKTFLDIGCGSGLFSLAAYRLGAHVFSFDFDPDSVACAQQLRERYAAGDPAWVVERGSALDRGFLEKQGLHDVVYSWGVLHHTGAMWKALDNAAVPVKPGGLLFISIYNDQGLRSNRWLAVKKAYNRMPPHLRFAILWPAFLVTWGPRLLKDALTLRPMKHWREAKGRGMSPWYDHVDWVGGYPFEVAKPEEILRFYRARGFQLMDLETAGGSVGCNQYVFQRVVSDEIGHARAQAD